MITKNRAARAVGMSLFLFAPLGAYADKPTQVEVVNPVVPVEVSNADPISVGITSLPLKPSEIPANRHQRTISVDEWSASSDGNSYITISYDIWGIPSDKILVVEFVSALARVNPGDRAYLTVICQGAASNIGATDILMPLAATGTFGGREHLIGSGPAKCYTGSSIIVMLSRNSTVPADSRRSAQVSVIGYLMDKPE